MSKILQLKKWLTLKDCAKRFTLELGEEINESDLFQLALDKSLTISWLLSHRYYTEVKREDRQHFHVYRPIDFTPIRINGPMPLDLDLNVRVQEWYRHILVHNDAGTFDYQRDTILDGDRTGAIFGVTLIENNKLYQELDDNGFEAGPITFPKITELVIRKEDADTFLNNLANTQVTTPHTSTKTNNTQLKLIGALSDALIGGLTGTKNKDAAAILSSLSQKGVDHPISQRKLSDYLQEAYEQYDVKIES